VIGVSPATCLGPLSVVRPAAPFPNSSVERCSLAAPHSHRQRQRPCTRLWRSREPPCAKAGEPGVSSVADQIPRGYRPRNGVVSPFVGLLDIMASSPPPGHPPRVWVSSPTTRLSSGDRAFARADTTVWSCAGTSGVIGACVRAVRSGARQAPRLPGRQINGHFGQPSAPRIDIRLAPSLRIGARRFATLSLPTRAGTARPRDRFAVCVRSLRRAPRR
jgi:hypothetical protein